MLAILTGNVGHIDLVLVWDDSSLVGLCMKANKSLYSAVTICGIPVVSKLNFYTLTRDLKK